MKVGLIAFASSLLVLACTTDVVGPPPVMTSFSPSSAACQAIQYDLAVSLGPTGFTGTVTGDLEGTVRVLFPQNPTVHGVASLNDGTDFIDVTGGSFPELVGTTLEHRHSNMGVFAPGLGAVARLNGHGRLVGAVDGRLTFHGTIGTAFPFPGEATYQGNICIP